MGRRWLIWSGAGVLVAVIVLVSLALWLGPAPQFTFLEGHKPYLAFPEPDDPDRSRPPVTYYSFKAEFEPLIRRARKELWARGYQEQPPSPYVFDPSLLFTLDARAPGPTVMIWKDMRTVSGPVREFDNKGWVTVRIEGSPPGPSLFERFRAWLGL